MSFHFDYRIPDPHPLTNNRRTETVTELHLLFFIFRLLSIPETILSIAAPTNGELSSHASIKGPTDEVPYCGAPALIARECNRDGIPLSGRKQSISLRPGHYSAAYQTFLAGYDDDGV